MMYLFVDLVHVAQFQHAQECMTRRKLHTSQGKRVTTGPWQIFDVPTKVCYSIFI